MGGDILRKRGIKYTLIGCLSVVFILLIGAITWLNQSYKPTEELLRLVPEDQYNKVGDFYVFDPKIDFNKVGVILYPGALVEPLSYAYYANELSKQGYLVAIT